MKTQTDTPIAMEFANAGKPIRVRVRKGEYVYNGALWREGQVLDIDRPEDFSARAMERVAPTTRLSNPMSPKDALDKATRIIRYGRLGLEPPEPPGGSDSVEVI